MAALDWLQQLLGGGQYGDPSTPAMPTSPLEGNLYTGGALGQAGLPADGAKGYTADVLQHLKDVIGGKVAAGGALAQNNYDPRASFAQNALNPAGIEQATDVAFGIGPGAIRAPKPAPAIGRFAQYAEEYPPVGPPEIQVGKRGNQFEAKVLTPEAMAFAKERNLIQAEMNKSGYEPYFNPAERTYVDPSNYPPPNTDTSKLVPKRAATVDQYMEVIGAPETTKALRAAYDSGIELGNAEHWYAMGQLEKKYIAQFGETAGRSKFLDEFAAPMASTTSGQNPAANLMTAHFLEYQRARGEPAPVANQLPYPVGGQYAGTNLRDYAKMREGGGYSALGAGQPKMHNFTRSFLGDLSHPVMDEQMAEGMLAHATTPNFAKNARTTAYGLVEDPVNVEAARLGIAPGNVQDVAWAGFKNEPGKPMISIVNEAIERTHRLTGMPREEIVRRGLLGKEIPLYGLLGSAGLGALGGRGEQ